MSELLSSDEHLPGLSKREILEGMTPDQLVDLILTNGQQVSDIERQMSLASEVLEGAYGVSVETMLDERNKQNGYES